MKDREIALLLRWLIKHYSTSIINGMFGYVDSMGREVDIQTIIEHYNPQQDVDDVEKLSDAEEYFKETRNLSCALCGFFCNNAHHHNNWFDTTKPIEVIKERGVNKNEKLKNVDDEKLGTEWLYENLKKSDRRMWEKLLEEAKQMELTAKETLYTEEQVREAFILGMESSSKYSPKSTFEEFIQSLKQPKK